jgi:site-specific recombinase XerD
MTTEAITPLRQRMIEDMNARKLCAGTQRGHIRSCKRFAAFLKRSPETATFEDIRRFQLHLAETGVSICTRNVIMTGLRFLFRVTLRRWDLTEEVYHIREPQKLPLVMSIDEMKRSLAVASSLKTRARACPPESFAAPIRTAIRRMRSGCCARAVSGHTAAPPSIIMNSRLFS